MFGYSMNREVCNQPGLSIGDGTVLALSWLDLQYVISGLALQKREGLFTLGRDNGPVFKQEITTMVADLIDFSLKCVIHGLKKTHPFNGMRCGTHPGWGC